MLSLPESWDLRLCEDLMLLLETRQHQEILTHCSAIRSGQRSDLPDLDHCTFPEGETETAITTATPEHFEVCTSSSGHHRLLHLVLAHSWVLTGAIPIPIEETEVKAPAGCHTNEWLPDALRRGLRCQGAPRHARSPDTTTEKTSPSPSPSV